MAAADNGNDGNDGNGNDDDKYTGGTSAVVAAADSTAERDSGVGSGAANGESGSVDSGSADGNGSGANSGSDSGSDSAGVEYVTYRTASGELRQRRKRRDSRDNRSDGNARGTSDASGTASAAESTGQVNETVSRVNPPRRTRSTTGAAPMAQNTRELVKDAYEFVFWSIGAATKVPDWELAPDESKELAVRSQNFWNSLDKKKAQKFEAFANKWLPGITLAGAIIAVAAPRVKKTQQVIQERKRGPIQQREQQRTEPASQPEPARYAATPSNESDTSAGSQPSAELNAQPLTDFSDIEISQ